MLNTLRASYNNKEYILVQDVIFKKVKDGIDCIVIIQETIEKYGWISAEDLYDLAIAFNALDDPHENHNYLYGIVGFHYPNIKQINDITIVNTYKGYMLAFPVLDTMDNPFKKWLPDV